MRVKGATVQSFLLAAALLAALAWSVVHGVAQAGELKGVALQSGATGTRADIRLDGEVAYQVLSLSGPDRLVVDLPGTALDPHAALPGAEGLVRGVRSGHPVPGTTRIVFDLSDAVVALKPRFEQAADGVHLVVEWPGDGAPASASTTPAPAAPLASTPAPSAAQGPSADPIAAFATAGRPAGQAAANGAPAAAAVVPAARAPSPASPAPAADEAPVKTVQDIARRAGMRPLVIAIDAGHGGQDPGARGPGGSREKDITLRIAKELARQVDATPGLKAYLTRDGDYFIPLTRRYQLAREHKADLFVSVHADSFTSPSAAGSSVFVLSKRGASSQAARWLASQENAADLVGGVKLQDKDDTLASVLLDLSQSATQKASEDMANQVLSGLRQLGRVHKEHIERANFVVLRSPDVPSMLVETAFISNPSEERKLNDPGHQSQLARAILKGVTGYFTRQPPPGTLYAARAEAAGGGAYGGGSP